MKYPSCSDRDKHFYEHLDKFYSTFHLIQEIQKHAPERMSKTLANIQQELNVGYDTVEETVRTQNLLGCLLWVMDSEKKNEAVEMINKSLEIDPFNIISLANKANIMRCRLQFSISESLLAQLEDLATLNTFDDLLINSEAEIAYSFSRFGPIFIRSAIDFYERVVATRPRKCLWKFGLALAYKRYAHSLNSPNILDATTCRTNDISADLFLDIVNHSSSKLLRARSWCELSDLMKFRKENGIREEFPKLNPLHCIKRALALEMSDYNVLQRCGRSYRYLGKLSLSDYYLRRSIELHDTPFARHSLAQTLKAICLKEKERNHEKTRETVHNEVTNNPVCTAGALIRKRSHVVLCHNNIFLLEAIEHLQAAIKLNNGPFVNALYDLGIIYRMLGQCDNAIESFGQLETLPEVSTTERANALEQLGLTKVDMSYSTNLTEQQRNDLKNDGQATLSRAIELEASILKDIPQLEPAWKAPQIMERFIKYDGCDEDNTKIKEQVKFYEMIGKFEEAIHLLEYLVSLDDPDQNDCINLVELYAKRGSGEDFNNAVSLLQVLSSEEKPRQAITRELFCSLHIQAGMNSIQNGLFHQARERLETAYINMRVPHTAEYENQVIVLSQHCSNPESNFAHRVQQLLQIYCNLKVTINDEDCIPGRNVREYYETTFKCCSSLLVIPSGEKEVHDPTMLYAKSAIEMPAFRPKFIVLTDNDLHNDLSFGGLPRIALPPSDNQDGIQWVEQFLLLVVEMGHLQ